MDIGIATSIDGLIANTHTSGNTIWEKLLFEDIVRGKERLGLQTTNHSSGAHES